MKKYAEIENSINKFSSLDLSGIDEYYLIGEKISLINTNDSEFKRVFSLYCRNYCNFLINHTDFNYLLEVYNNVNSEIIKNFTDNFIYIKLLVEVNNKILIMVKNDNFNLNLDNLQLSSWEPLDIYIQLLKKINIEDNNVFDKGIILPMRIWVDTLVLNDRIQNLEKIANNHKKNVAKYDIYRFFHWISLRYKKLLKQKNENLQINRVNRYIKKLSQNINDTTKNNIIIEAIGTYQNYIKTLKDMEDKIPLNQKKSRLSLSKEEMIPTVMAVGAVLISGIILKAIN